MGLGLMSIRVERSEVNPEDGRCQYYVSLQPHVKRDDADVHSRIPVEVALSVSETGDLADLSFEIPKKYRTQHALSLISGAGKVARQSQGPVTYVDPRVFISVPGFNGDAVFTAAANLELDAGGRIIGVEVH